MQWAWGLKVPTSKYVFLYCPPRNHCMATMSRHAPGWVIKVAPVITSPVIGCRSCKDDTESNLSCGWSGPTCETSLRRHPG